MMRTILAAGALAALLLTACVPIQPESGAPAGTVPGEAADPLAGTSWQLANLAGADGALAPVDEGVEVTAVFEDGVMAGSGGCNRYSAGYTVDGSALIWGGPPISTMMACMGPAMNVETAFLSALPQVTSFSLEADTLTLIGGDGAALLEFVPWVPASLTGTQWSVTGININNGVRTLVIGTEISAVFGEDGQLTGQACNNYFGPFTVEGDSIGIGPVASTMMACPEPEGAMEQEAGYLAALERATTWSIQGQQLELRSDDGALQVSFAAAE